jgi:hypothetical protein
VRLTLLGALLATACSAPAAPGPDAPDASALVPQVPPRDRQALEAWLAAGHHREAPWLCESAISAPRLGGTHGRHRVCSNQRLLASTSGVYPAGAASVKDLFALDDSPAGFAVAVKIADGEGPRTWTWFERRGADPTAAPVAMGVGVPDCAVCHSTAPRDYIFIRAE